MRSKGEGTVYELGSRPDPITGKVTHTGVWQASRSVVVDGRRIRIAGTSRSKQEAIDRREEKYRQFLENPDSKKKVVPRNSGHDARPGLMTGDYLLEWFSRLDRERVQASTRRAYKARVDHLVAALGQVPLAELNGDHIENLFHGILPKKVKADGTPLLGLTARLSIWKCLDAALTKAVARNELLRNPMKGLNPPRPKPKDDDLKDKMWLPGFLLSKLENEALQDRLRWSCAFLLGLRQSEVLGLTWDCVSNVKSPSKESTMTVKQQLSRHDGNFDGETNLYIKTQTKSKNQRQFVLPPGIKKMFLELKKERETQKRDDPNWAPYKGLEDLVFVTKTGKPIRQQDDSIAWHALLARYSVEGARPVPDIRGHAARHLMISHLFKLGTVPVETIRDIAGHNTAFITRAFYKHATSKAAAPALRDLEVEIQAQVAERNHVESAAS